MKHYPFFEADWELLTLAYQAFTYLAQGIILWGFPTQRTLVSSARSTPQMTWWCGRKRNAVKLHIIAFSPPLLHREQVSQHSHRTASLGKEGLCLGPAALCPRLCFRYLPTKTFPQGWLLIIGAGTRVPAERSFLLSLEGGFATPHVII